MGSKLPAVLRRLPELGEDAGRLGDLAARLGHEFVDLGLLRVALTVGSWTNENPKAGWPSNACLEFFGDAVLDLVAADTLWQRFPEATEGLLTRLRAAVVSERALARAAGRVGLGEWLFLGRGDEQNGARERDSTLADALEAILGAVFLDARAQGQDPILAVGVVFELVFGEQVASLCEDDGLDPKSALQQLVQAGPRRLTPTYVALAEGVGDAPWRARVELRPAEGEVEVLGEGEGKNLRAAEHAAAKAALARLAGEAPD